MIDTESTHNKDVFIWIVTSVNRVVSWVNRSGLGMDHIIDYVKINIIYKNDARYFQD